jgi:hypothetical protein
VKSIRRRLAVAGSIAALAGLAGFAYADGNGPQSQPPAMFASAHGGHNAAVSTRASGSRMKRKRRRTVAAASAPAARPVPLKTRASGHGRHGRGEREREGRDDGARAGVDA